MSLRKISADRLSNLPDEILIHILSFLPTKQAIIASILSKRWIHLWRHVPVLNFLNTKVNNQQDKYSFIQFINTNFLLQQAPATSHSIDTFFLEVQYKLPYHDRSNILIYIRDWINHVVERNVQYLSLHIHYSCGLPTSILSCKTLVVLKLRGFYVDHDFPLPFVFPSLKTLNLEKVCFRQWQDYMLLLDGCSVLEDLQLSYIGFPRSLPFKKKKNFILAPSDFGFGPLDFEQFEKASLLRKLNRADITYCNCHFPVKALSNLEFLRIHLWKGYHPNGFPTFHNLTHLAVNYDCNFVVQMLQHCPKLQNLELFPKVKYGWKDEYITEDDQENRTDLEFVPHLSLTTCTIQDYEHTTLESLIMLARFILKNARVLETMTIWSNGERFNEIKRKLSSCPRASATCQLSIQFMANIVYK